MLRVGAATLCVTGRRTQTLPHMTQRSPSAKTSTVPPSVGSARLGSARLGSALAQANGVHRKLSSVEAIAASALLFIVVVLPL